MTEQSAFQCVNRLFARSSNPTGPLPSFHLILCSRFRPDESMHLGFACIINFVWAMDTPIMGKNVLVPNQTPQTARRVCKIGSFPTMPAPLPTASTLGELKATGYQSRSVKMEMRENLLRKLRSGEPIFPGIMGYEETVLPQIQNAILSQHDMLLLGLRGQGKTRILRMLTGLLDEYLPVISGSEINDDPFAPLSKYAKDQLAVHGDKTPITWVKREDRYNEKLATPDVTIADLVGEVDLIKHAEGRHLSNEDVMHFGLIPRSHRGIFCMNELPDLSPKIQVGLFNVLEERDIQIRGFTVRLPLDFFFDVTATPEIYTNRGRIVTPLKDRIGSVVRTHYPLTRELGVQITDENAWIDRGSSLKVYIPRFVKEIVEETSRLARVSPHVNHASGVSVRMSVANLENIVSNAERRALKQGQSHAVVRISDLTAMQASSRGKVELSLSEDAGDEDRLLSRITSEAVKTIFDLSLTPKTYKNVVDYFENGGSLIADDRVSASDFLKTAEEIRGFMPQLAEAKSALAINETIPNEAQPELLASIAELILEGLYCHNRLSKTGGTYQI